MNLWSEAVTVLRMLRPPRGADSHAARLEAFYRDQAEAYDVFRRRLLYGREDLIASLEIPPDAHVIDLGGGTGATVEMLGDRRTAFRRVTIVDLCPSLLRVAGQRIHGRGWSNVETVLADARDYQPAEPADAVICSYTLTMMPDWFRVIDRIRAWLRPGGLIGVVDFYVARKWPAPDRLRHTAFQRTFWPLMFGWDDVFLSPDHLPYLLERFRPVKVEERSARHPYLWWLRMPYYMFVGAKT